MTTRGSTARCNRKKNSHYRQMAYVCVHMCIHTGQVTGPQERNTGLSFISLGSDRHTWCPLQVLTQIDTHTYTQALLDSPCLILRVVSADGTHRTVKRRKTEEEREMVEAKSDGEKQLAHKQVTPSNLELFCNNVLKT